MTAATNRFTVTSLFPDMEADNCGPRPYRFQHATQAEFLAALASWQTLFLAELRKATT